METKSTSVNMAMPIMIESMVNSYPDNCRCLKCLGATVTAIRSDDKEDKKSLIAKAWRSPPMTRASYR
jgi:hypothetical protein